MRRRAPNHEMPGLPPDQDAIDTAAQPLALQAIYAAHLRRTRAVQSSADRALNNIHRVLSADHAAATAPPDTAPPPERKRREDELEPSSLIPIRRKIGASALGVPQGESPMQKTA